MTKQDIAHLKQSTIILFTGGILATIICGLLIVNKVWLGPYVHKNACDLMPLNEAQSLAGTKLEVSNRLDNKITNVADFNYGQSICAYGSAPLGAGVTQSYEDYAKRGDVQLDVKQYDTHSAKAEDIFLKPFDQGHSSNGAKRVDGPWDAAYYSSKDGTLFIRKRNYLIIVTYSITNNETRTQAYSKDKVVNAGEQIVSKLNSL